MGYEGNDSKWLKAHKCLDQSITFTKMKKEDKKQTCLSAAHPKLSTGTIQEETELPFSVSAYLFPVMRADLTEADEKRKCSVNCPELNES